MQPLDRAVIGHRPMQIRLWISYSHGRAYICWHTLSQCTHARTHTRTERSSFALTPHRHSILSDAISVPAPPSGNIRFSLANRLTTDRIPLYKRMSLLSVTDHELEVNGQMEATMTGAARPSPIRRQLHPAARHRNCISIHGTFLRVVLMFSSEFQKHEIRFTLDADDKECLCLDQGQQTDPAIPCVYAGPRK
jgi:hypothetical protein